MTGLIDPFFPCERQTTLAAGIDALHSLDQAPALAGDLREFLVDLVARGLDGECQTRLISAGNDRLVAKVIELTAVRHHLPPVAWCWLALGSEGRHEQTFVTDQDNGLIFNAADAREAEALRAVFLPFAEECNQHLADCGFKLCPGRIMAGNPACCLSFEEWRTQFIDWVRRPEPLALLNASIFFDLRPLFGQFELAESLRRVMLGLTGDTPSFLHLMAANALQAEVPLNFRGEVAVDDGKLLDLKKFGSRIFVDAARIFALASGCSAVNTAERLHQAGQAAGLSGGDLAGIQAAFSHLLHLRIDRQLADRVAGEGERHGIMVSGLHDMDRAILRESLKQARRLQQRLKLNYAL